MLLSDEEIAIFGYVAGFALVASFVPQIVKIIIMKSAEEISLWFLIIQFIVNILMIVYGILLEQKPIYIPISVLLFEKLVMFFLKYYYHFKYPSEPTEIPDTDTPDVEAQSKDSDLGV